MAERRMFAKTIIDSDAFLDMPMSAQLLYFHLSMRADDEGFLNNPKKIQRMIGASDDDLTLLKLKKFIISFDTGVVVIKHWRINNYLQKDRCKSTIYQKEKSMLGIKDNKAYTLNFDDPKTKRLEDTSKAYTERIQDVYSSDTDCIHDVYSSDTDCIHDQNGQKSENRMNTDENAMYTDCIQDGYNSYTQVRLGKVSIGKDSIGKDRLGIVCQTSENETKAETKTEQKTEPDKTVVKDIIIAKWNTLQDIGIEKIKYISPKREEKLINLLNEYGLSSFDDAIDAIRKSDFLQGKKEGYTWKIDFNWLIEPIHYSAVIEGSYKDYEPFPTKQGKAKAKGFTQIENHKENWPELEGQLLDN